MHLAVIGSRRRNEPEHVLACIRSLRPTSIITGGAEGIDANAEAAAVSLGLSVTVMRPIKSGVTSRGKVMRAIRERNEAIVQSCDTVLAFPASDRTGGTERVIAYAQKLGKPVFIMASSEQAQPQLLSALVS